ncbi:MAG: phytanoyl-CoA dioxygenase family protein, partial [Paracoccaceae bacterium]
MTPEEIERFQEDGAVCLRGVFADWVEVIAAGIGRNMAEPGPYASENAVTEGRFFDDYCNWTRIPEFERVVRESPAAKIAAAAMRSDSAQFFHDHVLVKEPGTAKPTPWHQDAPYYFVEGRQTVSFWIPIDPVQDATLRLIAGSHRWPRMVRPVSWADDSDFYKDKQEWTPVPDPDADPGDTKVLEWPMQPGDCVLFDYRTAHGARGNPHGARRRALSLRWVGDDARYVERPGRTSPPFPGHDMKPGERLREDWFPVIEGGG